MSPSPAPRFEPGSLVTIDAADSVYHGQVGEVVRPSPRHPGIYWIRINARNLPSPVQFRAAELVAHPTKPQAQGK